MKRALINFGGPALALVLTVGWFLSVGNQVPAWVERFLNTKNPPPLVLGRVTAVTGTAHLTRDYLELSVEENLRDGDTVQTGPEGSLNFRLSSQGEFALLPDSRLTLELWDPADPNSPVYLKVSRGNVTTVKVGTPGRTYLIHQGQLYSPGQKHPKTILGLSLSRPPGPPLQLAPIEAVEEPETPNAPAFKVNDAGQPDTLANEVIDRMMTEQSDHLQRCWITRLKQNPRARARLNLQFEISRRGRVRDFKVIEGAGNSPELDLCVSRVIESIRFPAFKGADITLNYPLTFE